MAAASLLAVASLASCGTVEGVSSERPRAMTPEREYKQMNERIAANKADRAERAAKAEAAHVRAYTERHGFPPKN